MEDKNPQGKLSQAEAIAQRGTQDDMEILLMILAENPMLRKRVMDSIRFHRSGSGGGVNVPDGDKKKKKKSA